MAHKSKIQTILESCKKNRNQLIGTAFVLVLAVAVMLIPYFSTQQKSNSLQNELSALFEQNAVSSYEEARSLLHKKGYREEDLFSKEQNTVYVWNSVSNLVYNVSQNSVSLSPSLTTFDYTGKMCLGYFYQGMPSYVLAQPESIREELLSIYRSDPKETLSFSSEGIFGAFIRFAYQRTLFVEQTAAGISCYIEGKGALSEAFDSVRLTIVRNLDINALDKSVLDLNLSLAQQAISSSHEVVIRKDVKSLPAELFRGMSNLRRFSVESSAFRLESEALIDNASQKLLAFPCKSDKKEIIISKDVLSIAEGAFFGASISSLTVPFVGLQRETSFPPLRLFGTVFRAKNGYPQIVGDSYVSYAIPSTLREVIVTDETILCRGAFSGCSALQSIVLNEGIHSIGEYAFDRCNALEDLAIPDSVVFMEMDADNALTGLKKLSLPEGLSLPFAEGFPNRRTENGRTVYTR